MKVLDLQCRSGHSFEGWFGSQADYDGQREQGLVVCPVCNDSVITKMLSAPRLNLGHGVAPELNRADTAQAQDQQTQAQGGGRGAERSPEQNTDPALAARLASVPTTSTPGGMAAAQAGHFESVGLPPDALQQMQAALLSMARHVLAHTEDVGSQFAEEARKIHYGERENSPIRGQATRQEAEDLLDEGIEIMPFILPESLKGPLQ